MVPCFLWCCANSMYARRSSHCLRGNSWVFASFNPPYITGMMASGASPIYAGIYQFIIVAMILATWRSCQST